MNVKKMWRKGLLFAVLAMALLTVCAGAHESDPVWELPEPLCLGEDSNGGGSVVLQGTADMDGAMAALHAGMLEMKTEIDISAYGIPADEETSGLLLESLTRNYPDLFALETFGYSYSSSTNTMVKLMPVYKMSSDEYTQARTIYDRELNHIVGLVDESWSELQKVLFVHDYLAANYEYDLSYRIYDAYHFFKEKTGVCQAYTLAYMAVLQKLNIEISYVISDNINHIWNLVKLNGNWYHVDVTHDDPVADRIGYARHMHFLRSDTGLEGHDKAGKERDWVYGISEGCKDTAYDTYFWSKAYSPFLNVDGTWYFIESDTKEVEGRLYILASRLMRWDGEDGSTNATIEDCFQTPGTGLGYFNGKLYFNTFDNLCSYDIQEERLEELLPNNQAISGSRLEESEGSVILKYGVNLGNRVEMMTYIIDPYQTVSEGGYAYYQSGGSVYIKLDGTNCAAVMWYDQDGKMLGVNTFTDAGDWCVTPDEGAKKIQIIAVQNTTEWVAKCASCSLDA